MNSNRAAGAVALLLALLLAVGAAGAVTVSGADAPTDARVGTDAQATIVLTELYQDPSLEAWTLEGETELENVTWTVQVDDQAGTQIDQASADGRTFAHDVAIDSGAAELRVTITGTVPAVSNYTYAPAQTFLFAELSQTRQGGTSDVIGTYETHHYTEDSRAARQAIDGAQAAIDAAGGHQGAQRTLNSAVDAYDSGNFQLAVDLATQAEETANDAQSNRSRNRLVLIALGALVLLGLVVAAVVFWRRSRSHSRL